ncbi:MAG: hypothetical protein Q9227_001387 [Pyrenula ochraceoflavens]
MPEPLKSTEVNSKTDPTVAKQYDTSTPISKQINEFYSFADTQNCGLLTTTRPNVGPVGRSMSIARRQGPDFLFLANVHSRKFADLNANKTCQFTLQNSQSQDWASVTGEATVTSNSDPRIKGLYNPSLKAWFGDLGDGVHTGEPEDPRMALIEVKSGYVVYWKSTMESGEQFGKEVGTAAEKGQVAQTGITREIGGKDLEKARKDA